MFDHTPRRRRFVARRPLAVTLSLVLVAAVATGWAAIRTSGAASAATLANTPHYSLPLALQESLYFYDAEKSGPSRTLGDQPLEWRGDSEPTDSAVPLVPMSNWVGTNLSQAFINANKSILDPDGNGTVDLSGGFHDAGDHVKFGLPASYTAATLGWGMYEFKDAFVATGTWTHAVDEMKWFTDYFLRSTFLNSAGELVAFNYQVGDGSVDHGYWGPPELQPSKEFARPAYFATTEKPASDQTAGAAAALAVQSMLTKSTDAAYSTRCLNAAKALYAFSVAHRGLGYSGGFYGSSFDEDEMSWAAIWLYLATGTHSYIDAIMSTDTTGVYNGYMKKIVGNSTDRWNNIWVHSWDTKWGGVFALLDPAIQNDTAVPAKVRDDIHFFNKWHVEFWAHVTHDDGGTTFVPSSPSGYAMLNGWGSARYNTAGQLTLLAYRNHFPNDPKSVQFTDWAMGQMNYLMGDNPLNRSYIVGFGSTTPGIGSQVGGTATAAQHPHHAAAHGSTTNNQDDPPTHRHTLWGGLVGGPGMKDEHVDLTTDYVYNEVAVDYNAALVGALAGLYKYYGQGQTITKFVPPLEPATNDYYAYGAGGRVDTRAAQVTVTANAFGMRPPHYQRDMSARYYFNISELYKQGQDIGAISTEIYYDASAGTYGQPAKITAPVRWGGANSCVYYVTIDWTGVDVFGARPFQFGLVAAQSSNWKTYMDATNDYSYTGLAAGTYTATPDPYIPMYLSGKLVYGQEPSTTLDETCGSGGTTPPTGPATATLTAQYSAMATAASSGQIANKIQVTNTGTAPIPLSAVTIRYWFTAETTGQVIYACDYAPIGCANVKGSIGTVSPALATADRYLEISFTSGAGTLYPGGNTGAIQNRMQQGTYGNFNQANDYSFNASATSLIDWNRVTVYYNGQLVYGTPPS